MRKLILTMIAAIMVLLMQGAVVNAAPNPSGTGQPGQFCQAEPTGPAGLVSTTNGFTTKAVNVYAGAPGTESAEANPHAVSQYDVACYQVSQH